MRITVFLGIILLPLNARATQSAPHLDDPAAPVQLVSGWKYRWGDSPVNPHGTPVWILEDPGAREWIDTASLYSPPGGDGRNYIWFTAHLPEGDWINPALYIPSLAMTVEVYLDSVLIYECGPMYAHKNLKFAMTTNHLIPLNEDFLGGRLWLRIFSSDPNMIGIHSYEESVQIGAERDLLRYLFWKNADSSILGTLFIFTGLFAIFMGRFREKSIFPLSFGFFAFMLGVFYLTADPFLLYTVQSEPLKLYLRILSYLLFPVGLLMFLQHIVRTRRIMRFLWQLHAVFALVLLALDLTNVRPLPTSFFLFNILFFVSITISISVALRAARKGNTEARMFIAGFIVFGVLGLYDILMGLQIIPFWRWVSHWGALVFILTLAYILERRFYENHRKLKQYSRELEDKSEQLAEYSRTLEEKVAARTRALSEKNNELEETLIQLKNTQQQLVMQEKMASLGNLVAGVAHEINNPVGAVASAADVSNRCLDRMEEMIRNGESVKQILENRHFQTALRLLKENTDIALEGSTRVTAILSSLKNFARLDEAELQKADIHEGIDSTLTLLNHRFKNRIEVIRQYGDIPPIRCYPNQLNQVFMNLFSNAVDAIEDTGTITITTVRDGNTIRITVTDTGSGIAKKNLDNIFDPGFTTKGVGVGTGLGLSISYSIIQKHGGTVAVQSTEGEGSAFTISLPL